MRKLEYDIVDRKVVVNIDNLVCETADELLMSSLCKAIIKRGVRELQKRKSVLLTVFGTETLTPAHIAVFMKTLVFLSKMSAKLVPNVVEGSQAFFKDNAMLNELVEFLYNYWRSFDRFIICDSTGNDMDQRPYRTFNNTIGQLTNLIRATYRDIEENITGEHPRVYRQVQAGAEIAAIAIPKNIPYRSMFYRRLNTIPVIRQVLLHPPLILNPPINKRTGQFERIKENPIRSLLIAPNEWLCYPAKVGPLVILIYIHKNFYELGFSLCNLFDIADDADLQRKPDAIYMYGVPPQVASRYGDSKTVFYEDKKEQLLVAAVPHDDCYGYFGYLKKMVLTLHNIKMIQAGKMPYHGAFVRVVLHGNTAKNILIIGDTGAGKSETLEAFRELGSDSIQDMVIIADDMGSLEITSAGIVKGYGTEIGAFLRLDDLKPGYAFGQMDRAIIMCPGQVNARIVMPVTTLEHVLKGYAVDYVLYANNYENVDADHPLIEQFHKRDQALNVFREGTVMSKGTTTSTGIVHSYFANIFGPSQYREQHEKLAHKYFSAFFKKNIFVGQIRTRLGFPGYEQNGPLEAARALLKLIQSR